MIFKRVLLLLALLVMGRLSAGTDSLAELRAAREAMKKDYRKASSYLKHSHPEVRRLAVYTLAVHEGKKSIPVLCAAMSDKDDFVRLTAVRALCSMKSEPAVQKQLAETAQNDENALVQRLATDSSWPFHRKMMLLRQDASWDHDVKVVHSFQIPQDKWKLQADPRNKGHLKNWYAVKLDDSAWKSVKVGNWEQQGLPAYDGYAWYRIYFTMPEKIDSNAVEIHFGAVDESAWVWLNGVYLGEHDEGLAGWKTPFALDCRKEILWGKENVLVVRVLDRSAAGGIWKPVSVEVLK